MNTVQQCIHNLYSYNNKVLMTCHKYDADYITLTRFYFSSILPNLNQYINSLITNSYSKFTGTWLFNGSFLYIKLNI
jgi:hypothetical protein